MPRALRATLLVLLGLGVLGAFRYVDTETASEALSRLRGWALGGDQESSEVNWCPMDPEIVRKGPGMCPICSMELVPFERGAQPEPGVLVLSDRQVQQAGVRVGSARVRNLLREINATGKLEVNPAKRRAVVMPFPGTSVVTSVYVHSAGREVHAGEVLMEVENPQLLELLRDYRIVLKEIGKYRRARLEAEAGEALERMRVLSMQATAWGLEPSNLNFFASQPKFQFSDPSFPIYSPQAGAVLEEPAIYEGKRLDKGAELFRLADLGELWVYIDLYEHELPFVEVGQAVELTALAIPNEVFKATIRSIEPIVNPGTHTIRAQTRLPNAAGRLAPGMYVRSRIASPVPEALSVPESSVLQSGRRNVVIVSEGDGRYRPRVVVLGRQHLFLATSEDSDTAFGSDDERYHEVLDGLRPGERVVVAGNFLLNAEAQFQGVLKKMVEAHEAKQNARGTDQAEEKAMDGIFEAYFEIETALFEGRSERLAELGESLSSSAIGPEVGSGLAGSFEVLRREGDELAIKAREAQPDWEAIRTHFGSISRELVNFLREYAPERVSEGELYLFRCPMADDFGFDLWVQTSNELANPYMGQMMPDCGMPAELE